MYSMRSTSVRSENEKDNYKIRQNQNSLRVGCNHIFVPSLPEYELVS